MNEDFHAETRIDAHRTLVISSQAGRSFLDEAEAGLFPAGGRFFIRERDERLPSEHGSYMLANVATLAAAERLIKVFRSAALTGVGKENTQPI
jgi:hypothetical protein